MRQRFLLQILLLAQHVSGHHYAHHQELKSIIRWLLPVIFRAVVFKLLVWCGAEQHPANRTHNPQHGQNHIKKGKMMLVLSTHTSFKIGFSWDRNCKDGDLHGKLHNCPVNIVKECFAINI